MAGVGFDGAMISDADRKMKDRLGKLAYVWTGLRHVDGEPTTARVLIDGVNWFDDEASCVLIGNVGTITGGINAFDDAKPDDGWLDVGVATAQGALEWARALGTMAVGRSDTLAVRAHDPGPADRREARSPRCRTSWTAAPAPDQEVHRHGVPGAVKVCVPRS